MNLGNLPRLSQAKTRSISAENFTGEKGKAGMATEGTGAGCTIKQMICHYTLQLNCWKVFGPIIIPSGQDIWQALRIENSTVIPETFRIRHQKFISRKVKLDGHKLNFAALYGKFGEHLQAVAFAELDVRALCTLTLHYDADWYTACWTDGKEIYDARDGNGGAM